MLAAARDFAAWDTNPATRALHAALAAGEAGSAALAAAFGSSLEFGTAGLRGPMGAGCARMNEVTVMQAAQGLVAHVLAEHQAAAAAAVGSGAAAAAAGAGAGGAPPPAVVVGYDHRAQGGLTSRRFALLTAAVCVARGVRCHLFSATTATPLVPYAILALRAAAGVMVTASHNPKQDNGYKVYWGNGAQIISPVDKAIAAGMAQHAAPWAGGAAYAAALDGGAGEAALLAHPLLADPMPAMLPAYLAELTGRLCTARSRNATPAAPRPGITYTAMHGVGLAFAQAAFAAFDLPPFTQVQRQVQPDPDFPTVAFPNPEEGAGALQLAFETADAANDSLILANDPDADRLAVAEWVPADCSGSWAPRVRGAPGAWRVFTGNEIGALLAAWQWRQYLAAAPAGNATASSSSTYRAAAFMCASAVSSKFLARMAAVEGFTYEETLTGFKWMGNAMARAEARGQQPIFAFEEAIGFACGRSVRDKDGVSAAAVFGEMAGVLAGEGVSCSGALRALFTRYGAICCNNGYLVVADGRVTEAIFRRLQAGGRYWARCRSLGICGVRDLKWPGWDSATSGGSGGSGGSGSGAPTLPLSTSSHMLTYTFTNGVTATLRSSGTEPKLKWYAEGPSEAAVDGVVQCIMAEMLRPARHGLVRPAMLLRGGAVEQAEVEGGED